MMSQNHSFFNLPKRVRKVSLTKRTSISQLHQHFSQQNQHQQQSQQQQQHYSVRPDDLTDRGLLLAASGSGLNYQTNHHTSKLSAPEVSVANVSGSSSSSKRNCRKFSRFQWLCMFRRQFEEKAIMKQRNYLSKKCILEFIQNHKAGQTLHPELIRDSSRVLAVSPSNIIQQGEPETKIDEFRVYTMVSSYNKSKFDLDDLYFCLAGAQPTKATADAEPISSQSQNYVLPPPAASLLAPSHYPVAGHSPSGSSIFKRKTLNEQDPQTARFNQGQIKKAGFNAPSSSPEHIVQRSIPSIDLLMQQFRTLQIKSPKQFGKSDRSDLCSTSAFESYFREAQDAIRAMSRFAKGPVESKFFNQALDYRTYKSESSEDFYGVKLIELGNLNQLQRLFHSRPDYINPVIEYFKYIQAIRLYKAEFQLCIKAIFHQNLKIVNLMQNKLSSLDFLSDCKQLRFLNVNHNNISNLDGVKNCEHLLEIHCLNNHIQIPFKQHSLTQLVFLDMGYNQISRVESLACLESATALKILNLKQNPVVLSDRFKIWMAQSFPSIANYQIAQAHMFSEFHPFRDIAFLTDDQRRYSETRDRSTSKSNLSSVIIPPKRSRSSSSNIKKMST